MSNKTIFLASAAQVALYPLIVGQMKSGYMASRRGLVLEDFADAKPTVSKNLTTGIGANFDREGVVNFDLLNENVTKAIMDKAVKAVKTATGEEVTPRDIRKELMDMQFALQSRVGEPRRQSRIGLFGDHTGRPSADMKPVVAKAKAKSKKTAAKAKAKPATAKAKKAKTPTAKKARAAAPVEAVAA